MRNQELLPVQKKEKQLEPNQRNQRTKGRAERGRAKPKGAKPERVGSIEMETKITSLFLSKPLTLLSKVQNFCFSQALSWHCSLAGMLALSPFPMPNRADHLTPSTRQLSRELLSCTRRVTACWFKFIAGSRWSCQWLRRVPNPAAYWLLGTTSCSRAHSPKKLLIASCRS